MAAWHRFFWVPTLCPVLAGIAYSLGWLQAERMVVKGQGFETAFYWSPLVFLAVDTILFVGMVTAVAAVYAGPGIVRRAFSFFAGVVSLTALLLVPWR
jgi:hypothetical protein